MSKLPYEKFWRVVEVEKKFNSYSLQEADVLPTGGLALDVHPGTLPAGVAVLLACVQVVGTEEYSACFQGTYQRLQFTSVPEHNRMKTTVTNSMKDIVKLSHKVMESLYFLT